MREYHSSFASRAAWRDARCGDLADRADLAQEARRARFAVRQLARVRRAEAFAEILERRLREFERGRDVDPRAPDVAQVVRRRSERQHRVDFDAHRFERAAQRLDVRAIVEAEQRRTDDVDRGPFATRDVACEMFDDLAGRLRKGARLVVADRMRLREHDVGRDRSRGHHRDFAVERFLQDERRRTTRDDDEFGFAALVDFAQDRRQIGRFARERAFGHRAERKRRQHAEPFEHREHDRAVAVALGRAHDAVHARKRRRRFRNADVRGCLIIPEGEFHARTGCRKNSRSIGAASVPSRRRRSASASCRRSVVANIANRLAAPLNPWMG